MWIDDLLNPQKYQDGMKDLESLMTGANGPANSKDLPLAEYFNAYCSLEVSCLSHLINTVATATQLVRYIARKKLTMAHFWPKGQNAPPEFEAMPVFDKTDYDFYSRLIVLAALLHDCGKTLAHRSTPFDSPQHGAKGYLLFYEAMHVRPDPKQPGTNKKLPPTAEREDFEAFLKKQGIVGNAALQMMAAISVTTLFHDRLGVWLTGESGVQPVLETIASLEECAGFAKLNNYKLSFVLWLLHHADMMASITRGSFKAGNMRHPLCAEEPASPAADDIIEDWLQSEKALEMAELLPALLTGDKAFFEERARLDERVFRMIKAAALRDTEAAKLWNKTPDADKEARAEIRKCPIVKDRDEALVELFENYGVWDYSLGTFGYPLYHPVVMNIIKLTGMSTVKLNLLVYQWACILTTLLAGMKNTRMPKTFTLNLEYKNHDDPLLYISPPFARI